MSSRCIPSPCPLDFQCPPWVCVVFVVQFLQTALFGGPTSGSLQSVHGCTALAGQHGNTMHTLSTFLQPNLFAKQYCGPSSDRLCVFLLAGQVKDALPTIIGRCMCHRVQRRCRESNGLYGNTPFRNAQSTPNTHKRTTKGIGGMGTALWFWRFRWSLLTSGLLSKNNPRGAVLDVSDVNDFAVNHHHFYSVLHTIHINHFFQAAKY